MLSPKQCECAEAAETAFWETTPAPPSGSSAIPTLAPNGVLKSVNTLGRSPTLMRASFQRLRSSGVPKVLFFETNFVPFVSHRLYHCIPLFHHVEVSEQSPSARVFIPNPSRRHLSPYATIVSDSVQVAVDSQSKSVARQMQPLRPGIKAAADIKLSGRTYADQSS